MQPTPDITPTSIRSVPFYGNTSDDKNCVQACYGMIRSYFEPNWKLEDWDTWKQTTGFWPHGKTGGATWPLTSVLWFLDHGYDVQHITKFNYFRFIDEGAAYLLEALGDEAGQWEIEHIDIPAEQERAKQIIARDKVWQFHRPDFEDVKIYLERGYLIKCDVNINALNNLPGFRSHAVILIDYTKDSLIMHDPGLPPHPNRIISYERFLEVLANPNGIAEKMDAIKLP